MEKTVNEKMPFCFARWPESDKKPTTGFGENFMQKDEEAYPGMEGGIALRDGSDRVLHGLPKDCLSCGEPSVSKPVFKHCDTPFRLSMRTSVLSIEGFGR